jgi:hypothetical protein
MMEEGEKARRDAMMQSAAEGRMAEGWQKQKRKDWNLRAPEGTGCDGRGERDRMAEAAEGTRRKGLDDGRDGRGRGASDRMRRKGGRDQMAGGRNRMAEAEGTGWQRRKAPDGAAKRKKRERAKRKEQGMQRKGPDGRSRSGRTGT